MATEMEHVDREQDAYARGYADAIERFSQLVPFLPDPYGQRKLTEAIRIVQSMAPPPAPAGRGDG